MMSTSIDASPGRAVRFLSGGRAPEINVGPGLFKRGYNTVANGWAADIAAGPGEVAVRLSAGSPHSFSQYIVGPIDAVIADLRDRGFVELAERVADVTYPGTTPCARTAHALASLGYHVPAETLAEAARLAKVAIGDR